MEDREFTDHAQSCKACKNTLEGLVPPRNSRATCGVETSPPPELIERLSRLWPSAAAADNSAKPECWPNIDGYELLELLGRGGMSVVFRARQSALGREVAIKMLAVSDTATVIDARRLVHDATIAATLQHPHIVPIYGVGEEKGLPYCVMELIQGGSLASRVRDLISAPREAARLVAQAARALHYAHGKGVCHRDVKPANILLRVRAEASSLCEKGVPTPFSHRLSSRQCRIDQAVTLGSRRVRCRLRSGPAGAG